MVTMEAAMNEPIEDNPGVIARPPLIHAAFLALGFGLDAIWEIAVLEGSLQYVIGGAGIAGGVVLMALAMRRFSTAGTNIPTNRPSTAVVASGPYRFSRNPIYLSMLLIFTGIGLAADNGWLLMLVVPLVLIMRFGVIAREERYLERKFGEDYLRYKISVRRWI
jgi:protein-S-isoprenylcysteine O-methyltransferase Ste14